MALEGLSSMISNAAACARAAETRENQLQFRRLELDEMARAAEWVAHGPPRTFREAVQLLWFVILGVQYADSAHLVVPGHLDRTLAPYYFDDLEAGRISREEALQLIECLYILVNETVPDGLAVSVMVGGRDEHGEDVTNDLSYLCLQALRRTNLVYPTVGVCTHSGTPDALINLVVDLIAEGYSTPAFFGDETIQRGLARLEVPPAERSRYINSTCVEITPSGASNVWVASPYYNLSAVLLEELFDEKWEDAEEADFDDFLTAYFTRLERAVVEGAERQNQLRRDRARLGGKPLQSVFTRDCIETGRDIDRGGARYNWIECSFVGLANAADSLYAVREEVFRKKTTDIATLRSALAADFANAEVLRQRLANAYPKYGQGDEEVDSLVGKIVEEADRICQGIRVEPNGSRYVPGAFVWIMHERLGRQTGATPDGRRAFTPFADGAGPAQGRESNGPTAAILSTTSWDHGRLIGGVAFNMKFTADLLQTDAGKSGLRTLLLTYLRRGGFEVQVNVVDVRTLRDAAAHPEEHRDLVVRVGGYTDYFTRLTPQMQQEVIRRTEYSQVR
jgi:formate C-acetyltransferase